jgi:AcrR family transcriptional regulator
MNKPRGRPRGNPPTKTRIAKVAAELFLRHGYRGTTLRAVAAGAGVDSALISYHFGSKQGLFSESMRLRRHPSTELIAVLRGDPADLPERLLASVVRLWEDPEVGDPLTALVRMSIRDEQVMRVWCRWPRSPTCPPRTSHACWPPRCAPPSSARIPAGASEAVSYAVAQ